MDWHKLAEAEELHLGPDRSASDRRKSQLLRCLQRRSPIAVLTAGFMDWKCLLIPDPSKPFPILLRGEGSILHDLQLLKSIRSLHA